MTDDRLQLLEQRLQKAEKDARQAKSLAVALGVVGFLFPLGGAALFASGSLAARPSSSTPPTAQSPESEVAQESLTAPTRAAARVKGTVLKAPVTIVDRSGLAIARFETVNNGQPIMRLYNPYNPAVNGQYTGLSLVGGANGGGGVYSYKNSGQPVFQVSQGAEQTGGAAWWYGGNGLVRAYSGVNVAGDAGVIAVYDSGEKNVASLSSGFYGGYVAAYRPSGTTAASIGVNESGGVLDVYHNNTQRIVGIGAVPAGGSLTLWDSVGNVTTQAP